MSDLLQQAIIDATALKEAAIKNAENTLVEKYSQEFKDTVQKLLEQEEIAAATTSPAPEIDSTMDASANSAPNLNAAETETSDTSNQSSDKNDAFTKVKSAFLDGPDDEMITINFDQIKSTMMEMLGHTETVEEVYDAGGQKMDTAKDSLAEEELDLDESWTQEEIEENDTYGEAEAVNSESLELEEIELEEGTDTGADIATAGIARLSNAARLEKQAGDEKAKAALEKAEAAKKAGEEAKKQAPVQEDIELSENELMELAEELHIDLNPEHQGRGYMGSTVVEKELARNVEFAAARSDEAAKKREEENEKMKDLVKENTSLKVMNDKMILMLETLKVEVEKMNVSNAKLLYTNKALANISLNERQKKQIVESISKADSVLAAKTIYETLQNAVENSAAQKEAPQSLRETLNRATTPFVTKKTPANSINDIMAERMKALAGIKHTK